MDGYLASVVVISDAAGTWEGHVTDGGEAIEDSCKTRWPPVNMRLVMPSLYSGLCTVVSVQWSLITTYPYCAVFHHYLFIH